MIPRFSITEITDRYIRKNFERLQDFLKAESPLLGFKGFEVTFTKEDSHFKIKHNLGFLPKDVFLTSKIGSGTVTFHSSLATAESLDVTVTGNVTPDAPTTIRFFAGTYDPNPGAE